MTALFSSSANNSTQAFFTAVATDVYNFNTLRKQRTLTWSTKHNIEIKTIDSNTRVILDTQINVFLDAKSKIASVWEVVFPQLILSDLITKEVQS